MDINQLQLDDCRYNEGTICLVDKLMGAWGIVFRAWAHERSPSRGPTLAEIVYEISKSTDFQLVSNLISVISKLQKSRRFGQNARLSAYQLEYNLLGAGG